LWPLSRDIHPKPFIDLPDGETLVQKTYARALALDGVGRIITVTNQELYFLSENELAKVKPAGVGSTYLIEPCARDTAAAIAAAALHVEKTDGPDAVLLVFPADHMIADQAAFVSVVGEAAELAAQGKVVTIGIRPDRPETGFGYIEVEDGAVLRFVEKPDMATAAKYVRGGRHFWNAGIFCFRAGTMRDALETHFRQGLTHVAAALGDAREIIERGTRRFILDAGHYERIEPISIDKAVIEKVGNLGFVQARFDWSDIGSWTAFSGLTAADAAGNRIEGDAAVYRGAGSYVRADSRFVYLAGVDDLIVVDTPDALLITSREQARDMKPAMAQIQQSRGELVHSHRQVHRPWGSYTVIEEGPRYKIKRIVVKPGAKLSLQKHARRSEHWIVISGTARVTRGGDVFDLSENQSTYISMGEMHRLENPGSKPLAIVEVQSGDYLEEDDIERFEDTYGRV
jgi:mannose-1-phosphate guanylyltransferase